VSGGGGYPGGMRERHEGREPDGPAPEPGHEPARDGPGREGNPRRTRTDYEHGLPDYHDPIGGFGGAAPAYSALTLRAVMAAFGLVFAAGAAWIGFANGFTALGWIMVGVGVIAVGDLAWVLYRKWRGEPG
jgi:hypothetical protein